MIPDLHEEGYIEEIFSGQVLTVKENKAKNGTEILLENKNDTENQKWYRKHWDEIEEGYFILLNAEKHLTMDGPDKISMTGNTHCI